MKEQTGKRYVLVRGGGTIGSVEVNGTRVAGEGRVSFEGHYQGGQPDTEAVAYTGLSENNCESVLGAFADTVAGMLDNGLGIVVTHGTDSMEITARHLDSVLGDKLQRLGIPVVLTGANRPITDPETDAWRNLHLAQETAMRLGQGGVYVAFHGKIIPAETIVKEPYIPGISTEMHYISTDDPGYEDLLRRHEAWREEMREQILEEFRLTDVDGGKNNQIQIYRANLIPEEQVDIDEETLEDTRAIVVVLYHSSTAYTAEQKMSVANKIADWTMRGIPVFGVTENGEPVQIGLYETAKALDDAGLIASSLADLDTAVFRLMAILTSNPNVIKSEIIRLMTHENKE